MALNNNMNDKYDVVWQSKLVKLRGKELEIINLHVNDKIPVAKLATMYGCSRRPLIRIIENNGYKTRPSTSPELDGREEEIIKMYVEDQLTIETIRKKIGCTFNPIKKFLQRNGIPIRTLKESRNSEDGRPPSIAQRLTKPEDLEKAIELYYSGKTFQELGEMFGITPAGLRLKLLKNGVKIRTQSEIAKSETTQQRKKESYMAHYGVESPMQHPAINERSNINRYKFKAVDIHGRRFSHLQGYEAQGITYLIEQMNIDVNDIHSGRKVPKIKYSFDGKRKMYFPDMFVESKNLLVEVKCEYTYKNMLELNKAKREASLNAGYNYLTIIFDNSGKNIIEVF